MHIALVITLAALMGVDGGDALLTGSRLDREEATRKAQMIVVSKGDKRADPEMAFPISGGRLYQLRIEPSRWLKGWERRSEVVHIDYLRCLTFPKGGSESLPDPDKEYIFFISWTGRIQRECVKVIPATPEALGELEKMLRD